MSMFFSLFVILTLKKTTLFFTKIHLYFYCGFQKHVLCVVNELLVLATHLTEEIAFVIRILLTSPKKQDHCFAPIKKILQLFQIFFSCCSVLHFSFSPCQILTAQIILRFLNILFLLVFFLQLNFDSRWKRLLGAYIVFLHDMLV